VLALSSVPALSLNVNLMMVLSMWLTHYDHQINAVHDFNMFGGQDQENSSLVVELES